MFKQENGTSFGNDYCGSWNLKDENNGKTLLPNNCRRFLDSLFIADEYSKLCKGNQMCSLTMSNFTLKNLTESQKDSVDFKLCENELSYIYVQAECKLRPSEVKWNKLIGTVAAFIATVTCLAFSYSNYYRL
jgi:hypothetical protein